MRNTELRQKLRSVRRREAQLVEERQRGAQTGPEPTVELLKLWCALMPWLQRRKCHPTEPQNSVAGCIRQPSLVASVDRSILDTSVAAARCMLDLNAGAGQSQTALSAWVLVLLQGPEQTAGAITTCTSLKTPHSHGCGSAHAQWTCRLERAQLELLLRLKS